MKKILLTLLVLGLAFNAYAGAPSRDNTYVSDTTIEPADVMANENVIFTYLQNGVDTYATASIDAAAIAVGAVTTIEILNSTIASVDILDGTIAAADIATDAVTTTEILNGTIANADIADATITNAKLAQPITLDNVYNEGKTITQDDGAIAITSSDTNSSIEIDKTGVLAANKYGLYVYSNADQDNSPLVHFKLDNASSDNDVLYITNDGVSRSIYVDNTGSGSGLYLKTGASGGFSLYIDNASSTDSIRDDSGAKLTAAGVWTDVSSRKCKENFKDVNVLDKIKILPVQEYTYKTYRGKAENPKHISPVSEDFNSIFGLGDDKTIAAKNLGGVALRGIQELLVRVETLEARVTALENR